MLPWTTYVYKYGAAIWWTSGRMPFSMTLSSPYTWLGPLFPALSTITPVLDSG